MTAISTRAKLHRIEPHSGRSRFYSLSLQGELFGGTAVAREWGRIGSGGQVRYDRYLDDTQACAALKELARRKKGRGYAVVGGDQA